jgi:hypothetical protein
LSLALALAAGSVAAAVPDAQVDAAAQDPTQLPALMKGLSEFETSFLITRVVESAHGLELEPAQMRVLLAQLMAAAVRSAGDYAPQAAWGGVRSVNRDYIPVAVAAAVLAADQQAEAVKRWVVDAVDEADREAARKAAEDPEGTLGPGLSKLVRDYKAGPPPPTGDRQAVRAGALPASSPVADKAPDPEPEPVITPVAVETPTTATTTTAVPPVPPPYEGQ